MTGAKKLCPTLKGVSRDWKSLSEAQKKKYNKRARGKKTGWHVYVKERRKNC